MFYLTRRFLLKVRTMFKMTFYYVLFFSFGLRRKKKRNEPNKRKTGAVKRDFKTLQRKFLFTSAQ